MCSWSGSLLRSHQHDAGWQETTLPGTGGDVLRDTHGLQVDVLVSNIREYLEYQGCDDAFIEKVDDNRIMITVLEG